MVFALSTGNEIGIAVVGAAFILFALTSAFVIPRRNPSFPGRAVALYVLVSIGFFVAMISAILVFGKEKKTEAATREAAPAATAPAQAAAVGVTESEFKIALQGGSLAAGATTLDVHNAGKLAHDLVVKGPGAGGRTPLIQPGASAKLKVMLQKGPYELYCSVPGHKQAGMDLKLTVS